MRVLPDHALIGAAEIAQIYGLHRCSLSRCIARGTIPPPALRVERSRGPAAMKWRLGEVRRRVQNDNVTGAPPHGA